jgi:predicted nucleic acid-binding protein
MIVVLDASAALEIVLPGKRAAALGRYVEQAAWVIAPYLFLAEVSNAFWKYQHFHGMSISRCEEALDEAVSLVDDFADERDLYREAFAQACLAGRRAYDMFYLVLARRNNGLLLTTDSTLTALAKLYSVRLAGDAEQTP